MLMKQAERLHHTVKDKTKKKEMEKKLHSGSPVKSHFRKETNH